LQTGGEFEVAVPQDRAFAFVSDPFKLATCIPGCSDLREVAPGTYAAKLTNRVGPIAIAFDVTVELTKVEAPSAIDATVGGNAAGLGGRLTATASVRLEAIDAAVTRVRYTVDLGLTGKLGGIGQPVFRAKSDELSKKFGANVRAALEAGAKAGA
jgi:carbon monoxide dehydrogenase subunit G